MREIVSKYMNMYMYIYVGFKLSEPLVQIIGDTDIIYIARSRIFW